MIRFFSLIFILGASYGSFLGLVVFREQRSLSILHPRSYCDFCSFPLPLRALIPILGFFLMHGKCKHCQLQIPIYSVPLELSIGSLTTVFVAQTFDLLLFFVFFLLLFLSAEDLATKSLNSMPILIVQIVLLLIHPSFSSLLLLFLAILINFFDMVPRLITRQFGVGDILLILLFLQIGSWVFTVKIIFIACCFVILLYPFIKNKFPIPFVPFLSAGFIIILLIQKSV
ncbi:prepilin peptidase [Pediococcus claussenii]|uniref:Bacterial Peptidase A24 N-terminal domain protein n=1 Tax=Pediococcus claussenii (strain ATCC BAA-344 / DSM 14800 / JCM 18046 / KCTC 3811 / LMG 21948 / P06) TaxID=701521 RepID=G8PE59_PEDCP|nr:A24 family peptidase [Pediococcus claussenii]AEV95544.1 bacterial Peptidase A24 N-terminal domain protein [Pediococcus claussenii ATCC BAA-344]ANZ69067.1 hypothetical protein AYR57_01550 [Pediococcus claussenii]ANZ70883.1 hypothetical protein AYR58_01550 [Pediococcus claussenii]KRN20222.1 hypothetical protein IV79_GL000889 [Pediococcus claussenii]